jgi:hypothetical protein
LFEVLSKTSGNGKVLNIATVYLGYVPGEDVSASSPE